LRVEGSGLEVWDLKFGVKGLGLRVQVEGLGFGVYDLGFKTQSRYLREDQGLRVRGWGVRVEGFGLRVEGRRFTSQSSGVQGLGFRV
jgi:hypothetical protein